MLLRINRAVESSNRGVCFAFVCSYPHLYLLGCVMGLLSFGSAGRQGLPLSIALPAALFLPSWLLPLEAPSAPLSLPGSLELHSGSLCQGLARKALLFCPCKDQSEKVGCWAQHLTLFSRPFILRGTSSEEMKLQVKIPCFVLAAEPQISSFLSHCLTFCLCLCYRNRASGLCVQVFCSL